MRPTRTAAEAAPAAELTLGLAAFWPVSRMRGSTLGMALLALVTVLALLAFATAMRLGRGAMRTLDLDGRGWLESLERLGGGPRRAQG